MPERGRSPGAKGTAYPRSQRPQKAIPRPADSFSAGKGSPGFNTTSGKKSLSSQPPAPTVPSPANMVASPTRASLAGKTLHLQKKPGNATLDRASPAGPRRSAVPSRPPPPPVASKPLADPDAPVRISKLLAAQGFCSRREADAYIERGWVMVDGARVTELGTKVLPDAKISLSPEASQQQSRQMTLLLHKPVGYVSGQPEPGFQPAVVLIQPENQARGVGDLAFEPRWMKDLAPAGRLDIDSTGLLVLTQDGRIARQLIGEDSGIEKEYLVRVEGRLSVNGLALLNHGLSLDGKALRPAKVEWLNEDQLRFILREGKKRQIRRMCEMVGLTVVGLKRVRMGKVKLGDLPLGQWRYLRPGESF